MQTSQDFTGLGMPVFTAFGWAGEEAALNYALSQLELFAAALHESLNENQKENLPFHGLNREARASYLSGTEDPEQDVHLTFNARPTSLEVQMALTDKEALKRALARIEKDPQALRRLLAALGPGWSLRVQQMRVEETGEQSHYQDLYKDELANLTNETAQELFEKAIYLNKDDSWVTPLYLSMRLPAEQAAAMQGAIIPVIGEQLALLDPVVTVLRGRSTRKTLAASSRAKSGAKAASRKQPDLPQGPVEPPSDEGFSYVTELKPLHIDRGFVNLTPTHWPFFALSARTESRPVVVISDGKKDDDSAVWRLQPDDTARLMLGPQAHKWLEDHFVPGDHIQLMVTKLDSGAIQVVLAAPS